jgi:hypothetical protein
MTHPLRVGVQLCPAGTPDFAIWRQAVRDTESLGADVIFGHDHFQRVPDDDQAGVVFKTGLE